MFKGPELDWKSSHWSTFFFVDFGLDLFSLRSVSLCVCLCVCKRERRRDWTWSSHFHEKGVQRMDRGHIFFLWDSCRCDSESTRATSSIKLRIAAYLHPVFLDITWSEFLAKVILGSETPLCLFKTHLISQCKIKNVCRIKSTFPPDRKYFLSIYI